MDLRKLFRGPVRDKDTQIEYSSSKLDVSIRSEYMEQILTQLRRYEIPGDVVVVDVREAGQFEGHPVFQGALRLISWRRKPVIRLLLGLPLIELSVRKAIATTWVEEVSHFDGLWLHPSSQFDAHGAAELRGIILALESVASDGRGTVPGVDAAPEAMDNIRTGT